MDGLLAGVGEDNAVVGKDSAAKVRSDCVVDPFEYGAPWTDRHFGSETKIVPKNIIKQSHLFSEAAAEIAVESPWLNTEHCRAIRPQRTRSVVDRHRWPCVAKDRGAVGKPPPYWCHQAQRAKRAYEDCA